MTKKLLAVLLALVMCIGLVAACGGDAPAPTPAPPPPPPPVTPQTPDATPEPPPPEHLDVLREAYGLDEDLRFIEQRSIVVLTWDRAPEGSAFHATDNAFTDWIKEQMLELHNVVVTFDYVGRWQEVDELTMMMRERQAPDVCYTFNYGVIDEFGRQDMVVNLQPYLDASNDLFPNLWALLGYTNLYWNQDQETGRVWSILGTQAFLQRFVPFIREDWLNTLNMPLPTTLQEFEAALIAFRDNAELLLGADAAQMTPLHMTQDIGWVAGPMIESFIPNDITDKDFYITDVGAPRHFFRPSSKEAIRVLNRWYHEGLIHPDFALFGQGNETPDNFIRSGFVGALAGHSWDQPYRGGGDGWTGRMHELVGPEANFIAIDTFKNDAGEYRKYLGGSTDRNLFIPATTTEPVAALLYWDFLSRPETIQFLQTGWEGINYLVTPDGAWANQVVDNQLPQFMQSGMNYDLTMPINGLKLMDTELTVKTRALGYAGVEGRLIAQSFAVQTNGVRAIPLNMGTLTSEEGMADTIRERSQAAWALAIVAAPADFDSVYDREMQVLLNEFAQASMNERTQLWEARYGTETMLPTGD